MLVSVDEILYLTNKTGIRMLKRQSFRFSNLKFRFSARGETGNNEKKNDE